MSRIALIEPMKWDTLWISGGKELFELHRQEILSEDPRLPYSIDHVMLFKLEDLGIMQTLVASIAGHAVGYCIFFISPSLESCGNLCASQGPWFVSPKHRAGGLGIRLWEKSMEMLKGRGVRQILAHKYEGSPAGLEKFFDRKGSRFAQVWSIILEQ